MSHGILHKTVLDAFHLRNTAGDVGVELEIEGVNLPMEVKGWVPHEERSLRGEAREFVTHGAVTLDELRNRMVHLNRQLTRKGTTVNLTGRASTHVHLNMQRETMRTVFGTIFVATIAEPVLLSLCGPGRNGNLFCLPSFETGDLTQAVRAWVVGMLDYPVSDYGAHAWRARGKYASLNTDPLTTWGSIEFRCFPNTIDVDEVVRYATWCTRLRDFASNYPNFDYATLFDDVYERPETVYQLFQDDPEFRKKLVLTPNELIRAGVETSYEVWKHAQPAFLYEQPKKRERVKKDIPTQGLQAFAQIEEWQPAPALGDEG
jgi:hypothetical protein